MTKEINDFISGVTHRVDDKGITHFAVCDKEGWNKNIYNDIERIVKVLRYRGYDVQGTENNGLYEYVVTKR